MILYPLCSPAYLLGVHVFIINIIRKGVSQEDIIIMACEIIVTQRDVILLNSQHSYFLIFLCIASSRLFIFRDPMSEVKDSAWLICQISLRLHSPHTTEIPLRPFELLHTPGLINPTKLRSMDWNRIHAYLQGVGYIEEWNSTFPDINRQHIILNLLNNKAGS